MKILVTGANGMLGQDLCPLLEDEDYEVIETDKDTLDITNPAEATKIVSEQKPDFIVHCAAYTNVDEAENDLATALLINEKGTENIAIAAAKAGIPILYISTDYVFDGTKKSPYNPDDETNPINNYGLSKLKGEEAIKKHCEKYYIVRTSWLYGHHGKNFVETMIGLSEKNEELKIVNDQVGCPTWTVALCDGIIELIGELIGEPIDEAPEFGTYHICGSGKTTWFGFANEIFKIAGIKVKTIPVKTEEFPRPAKRPAYSVMNNEKICPDWKNSLKQYMELRDEE